MDMIPLLAMAILAIAIMIVHTVSDRDNDMTIEHRLKGTNLMIMLLTGIVYCSTVYVYLNIEGLK